MPLRFLLLLSLCLASISAQAPERPDFSGDWTAIMEEQNMIPPYLGEKIKIEQQGARFQISTNVEEKPVVFRFAVDGRLHANQALISKVSTSAKWEGEALILESTLVGKDGQKLIAKERWTLSPNGKKLAMQGYFEADKIKKNQLLQYERQ